MNENDVISILEENGYSASVINQFMTEVNFFSLKTETAIINAFAEWENNFKLAV